MVGKNLVLKAIEHESQDKEIGKRSLFAGVWGNEVIRQVYIGIYQQRSMEGGKLSPQFTGIAF